MEPTKKQIEQLKKIELDMLKEFVRVCEILDLKYYLIGGTLLGAVRHQGFIPWDDDIDVGMPREDYEKFLKQGQSLLPDNLFLQNIFTDKEYIMCFSKIRNSNTTFIETSVGKLKINHGVFIDVFPLDYYPDTLEEQKQVKKKEVWYKKRIACEYTLPNDNTVIRKVKKFVLRTIAPSIKKILYNREELHKTIPKSSLLINYGGAWGEREIISADWLGTGKKLIFEGLSLNVPVEYDKYLKQIYGEYMKLPPKEKRKGHHYTEVIDLENTYLKYMK